MLTRINKLRAYLGQPANNVIQFHEAELEIGSDGVGIWREWQTSSHNGDIFDEKTYFLTGPKLAKKLADVEKILMVEARQKVKEDMIAEEVNSRMEELGFAS